MRSAGQGFAAEAVSRGGDTNAPFADEGQCFLQGSGVCYLNWRRLKGGWNWLTRLRTA